jgi:hypothetical protein
MKNKEVVKEAVGYKYGTLAISVFLSFNFAVVFSSTHFRFRHAVQTNY